MNRKGRLYPLMLAILCGILILMLKQPHEKWDRIIESDGRGYYAWLPAVFIYQDLSFRFYDSHEQHYYPQGDRAFRKDYRYVTEEGTVNKYFPGIALLWLPFFLIVHLLVLLFGGDASGFSLPYQYGIAVAVLFYLWLGLEAARKLLTREQFKVPQGWLLVLMLAGTNLVYYATIEPTMAHVTLFGAINYCLYLLSSTPALRPAIYAAVLISTVLISRPTSVLFLLFLPFLMPLSAVRLWFRPSLLIRIIPVFLLILAIPFVLWKLQTGSWFVYTYGEENLNLLNPQLYKILFSFEKGWLLHTPMILLAFTGLVPLWRKDRSRAIWFLVAMTSLVWVLSSWWVWHYTSRFGHRAFTEFYFFIPLLLGFTYQHWGRRKFMIISTLLLILNLWQYYQHAKGITPFEKVSAESYFSNFFSYVPSATSVYADSGAVLQRYSTDFENNMPYWNGGTLSSEESYTGNSSTVTSRNNPYSTTLHIPLPVDTPYVVVAGGYFHSSVYNPGSTVVLEFSGKDGHSRYEPFYLKRYAWKNSWRPFSFDVIIRDIQPDSLKMYIWTQGTTDEVIHTDDLYLEIRKIPLD